MLDQKNEINALVIPEVEKTNFSVLSQEALGDSEVLLNVGYVGLCGSDLNTYLGRNPLSKYPVIPGHEIGGTVAAIGKNVPDGYSVGKSAIVIPYFECGTCKACQKQRPNACEFNKTLGVQRDGGMRSQIALDYSKVIINESLKDMELALIEPLAVGFHAVKRGQVQSGDIVVVIGGGVIGVGAMLGALQAGATVIGVELSVPKLEQLKKLGVHHVFSPETSDVTAEIAKLTNSKGVDVVIEAVGIPETFTNAIDWVCYAGQVVYVGYAKDSVCYDTKFFNLKELDIRGSRNATKSDFEDVIAFLETNSNISDQLISQVFSWKDAASAFEFWQASRGEVFKVLIEVGGK